MSETALQEIGNGSFIEAALNPLTVVDNYDASAIIPELNNSAVAAEQTLALPADASDGKAEATYPASAELSQLVEALGGVDGLRQIATIASHQNPVELIDGLLNTQQKQALIWSVIDDPNVQQTLLNDADVKRAISDEYFLGHDLDAVAEAVRESYEPDPEAQKRVLAKQQAIEQATKEVQLDIFHDSALEIASRFGIDLNDSRNGIAVDAWAQQVKAFAWENRSLIDDVIRNKAVGNKFYALIQSARLANVFKARMVQLCEQLNPTAKAEASKPKAPKPKADPVQSNVEIDDMFFMEKFSKEFSEARQARGL